MLTLIAYPDGAFASGGYFMSDLPGDSDAKERAIFGLPVYESPMKDFMEGRLNSRFAEQIPQNFAFVSGTEDDPEQLPTIYWIADIAIVQPGVLIDPPQSETNFFERIDYLSISAVHCKSGCIPRAFVTRG